MHTNVHCSTVYNSKDLEPTQMPIDDRLDRKNVAHIHHGILCSHQKRCIRVLCRDMDEPWNCHSQQTDTGTENQTLHVLTHRWVLNNENTWTQGGEHHTLGSVGGKQGSGSGRVGSWGERVWGEMPDIGDGAESNMHTTIQSLIHLTKTSNGERIPCLTNGVGKTG